MDSGADENFLDVNFASQAGIISEPLVKPMDADALDGRLLARVTHKTCPVLLILSGNHREQMQFHLITSPLAPIILGQPWDYITPISTGQLVRW